MKKYFLYFMLMTLVTLNYPSSSLANSGPVFWEGRPASDALVVDKNSPIIVEKEDLIFDFSNSDFLHSGEGMVKATYEMYNPTDEMLTVPMVFPIVESAYSYSPNLTSITGNGKVLPYDILLGRALPYENKKDYFDFETIIAELNKDPYEPRNFSENDTATLYSILVKPSSTEPSHFSININLEGEKTKVFTKGFNGFSKNNQEITLSAWVNQPTSLDVLIVGKKIAFETENEMDYETKSSQITVKDYLHKLIEANAEMTYSHIFPKEGLYNLFLKELDKYFDPQNGYCSFETVQEFVHQERILAFLYTVTFAPQSKQTVTVEYKTVGGMDKRDTPTPLYTFDYLLNPASNWDSFHNLTITVLSPEDAPYIVESTVDFEMDENYVHTAILEQLPADDLSFTLYKKEKVTFIDKAVKTITNPYSLIVTGGIVFIGLIFILVALFVVTLRGKK